MSRHLTHPLPTIRLHGATSNVRSSKNQLGGSDDQVRGLEQLEIRRTPPGVERIVSGFPGVENGSELAPVEEAE